MNQIQIFIIRAIALLTALPFHEFAHAYVATKLGDNTAKYNGRLTLNPLAHLDPFGSIMILLVGFGFAKPVPVNPMAFKNRRRDMAIVAAAGPLSNILLATIIMAISKVSSGFITASLPLDIAYFLLLFFQYSILINLSLAVFNLIPFPPLDGSKILDMFVPGFWNNLLYRYGQYVQIAFLFIVISGLLNGPISFFRNILYNAIDGLTFFL